MRIAIVEDNEFFRRGLVTILGSQGVTVAGVAGSGEEGLEVIRAVRPSVVLMDLHLPGIDGAETTAQLMRRPPSPAVIMLTISEAEGDLQRALRAGAAGYLLKDTPGAVIAEALRAVAEGQTPLSPPMVTKLAERMRDTAPQREADGSVDLSSRELAVLRHLARGQGNAEIGAELSLSPHTVKTHVSAIFVKLEVENRVQAATEAVRRGYA